ATPQPRPRLLRLRLAMTDTPHPRPLPPGEREFDGLLLRFALGRLEELLALAEDGIDGLRRAGIQAEPAGLDAAGRIELVGRRGEPGSGWAYRDADCIVGAPVGVADQVISLEHHGLDCFGQ